MMTNETLIEFIREHPDCKLTLLATPKDGRRHVLSTAKYPGEKVEAFHDILVVDSL